MRIVLSALLFVCTTSAIAALPPQYQNAKDLDAMAAFIKQHDWVMANLKSIDLETKTVHFGTDCRIEFVREYELDQPGPAAPLVFKESTCPLEWPDRT